MHECITEFMQGVTAGGADTNGLQQSLFPPAFTDLTVDIVLAVAVEMLKVC